MSGSASSSSSPSDQQSSNTSSDGKPYHPVEGVKLPEYKYNDQVEYETDSDDESRITEEEDKLYCAAVKASNGFDVPNLPGVIACCLIKPYPMTDYTRKKLQPCCIAGMKHYNQDKKTNYEFVRLEKANYQLSRGILYLLTFEGRTPENEIKIFEARVLDGILVDDDDGIEVEFCREKAPPIKTGMDLCSQILDVNAMN